MINNVVNLIAGLFFLIGVIIAIKVKDNKTLISYSVGMAFTVLILLLTIDIIPEAYELFNNHKILYMLIGSIVGFLVLFVIEKLVPHHNHYEEEKKHHHNNHLNHIGIMTSIALIIHNIVEGMSIYTVASHDLKTGLIYSLAVGLHNIPFGVEIASLFGNKIKSKKSIILIICLILSTFIGGLILYIFNSNLSDLLLGMLLSITIGMVIYLVFNELFIELKEHFNRAAILGIVTGILLMVIGVLL